MPIDRSRPLILYGSDKGLLACRVHLHRPDLVQRLSDSIDNLPRLKRQLSGKGIDRGDYESRHYGVWCPYMPVPKYSWEQRSDGDMADEFLETNDELFHEMSALLGELAPGVFKQFQCYPVPAGTSRDCGAWSSCVVNNGGNNPSKTNIHRDVKESRYGYSCVVPCGEFTGGAMILYDLGYILEMEPGDLLLFPDSLIHHSNEEAQGVRKSLVAFTQENMNDYWKRKYGSVLRRHAREETLKRQKKEERQRRKASKAI